MTGPLRSLLVGYGSIGRRHAKVIAALSPYLTIVEAKASARADAAAQHPSAIVAENIEDLDGQGQPWSSTLAVIATWGPSHATIFHALADRGVRHVLCEKPLASSVADAIGMARRAVSDGISLSVHHYLRYSCLVQELRALAEIHQLGAPVAVLLQGGAVCTVTNGIHWIDFASELFGAAPRRVVSTALGDPINARSPDLMIFGGTSVWSFDNNREAVISAWNTSSVGYTVYIWYRDAIAEIDPNLNVVVRRRDPAAVAAFPAVTRTGAARDVLFEGRFGAVPEFEEMMTAAIMEAVEEDPRIGPGTVGAAAVSSLVGALISSRERCAVDLPIDPESAWGREHWPMS